MTPNKQIIIFIFVLMFAYFFLAKWEMIDIEKTTHGKRHDVITTIGETE